MNKNLKRKLILSGLAMGVAAFATTATTYAWFTSNTTVSTSEINGNVAQDDSIYIKSDEDSNFGNQATITADNVKFTPAQTTDGKAFTGLESTNTLTADQHYLEFKLTFQGTSGTKIYLTQALFKNFEEVIPSFTLKADAGEDDSVLKGKDVQVDIIDSLALSISDDSDSSTKLYHYRQDSVGVKYNAATYYKNVTGNPLPEKDLGIKGFEQIYLANLSNTSVSTAILLGEIPADGINQLSITFRLFIDGWDNDCFDAVAT